MRRPSVRVAGLALRCAAYGVAWVLVAPARAQEGVPQEGPIRGEWEVLAGLAVVNGPAYLGSDERKTRALPLVAARWRNGALAGTDGFGFRFGSGSPVSWGLRLSIDPGRDQDDAAALKGMGDVPLRPEIGAFASYRLWPGLTVGTSVRYGSGEHRDGLKWDLSARTMLPVSSSFRLTAGATATFGNGRTMQTAFGVSDAQAATSGYPAFRPGAGIRDIGLQAGAVFVLGADTLLMLGLTVQSLQGDALDSPLVRQRTHTSLMTSVAYRF